MISNANREIGLGAAIVALAMLGLFVAIPLGVDAPENIEVRPLAPDFWPFIVLVFAGLAGAVVVLEGLSDRRRQTATSPVIASKDTTPETEVVEQDRPPAEAAVRVVAALGAIFALYFALPYTGIVLGTMLLLLFMMRFTGERRWRYILPIAILLPTLLYVFFVYVANVPMPLGLFEQLR
ncbi:tripartite tricarboxylate transporter TctB family protein [Pelagibius sp. Alg239-R121]|uniref:tripartite tricarboxylate transporter TctB family protein n=1 Tax=Pelagibius sp. Alg239-R121 TaxID=2993448 RepID=UPI0024A7579A|nr:tripartite tricarboxylate transporter TctB family protein [Pelagibius sp. Alg239-R121]